MDQQTMRGVADVSPAKAVSRDILALGLGLAAMAAVALTLAGLAGGAAFLAAWAFLGMRGLRTVYYSALFNGPLLVELGALAVSAAYICVGGAVIFVVRRLAGPRWRDSLAWRPAVRGWRTQWPIAAVALAYAFGTGLLLKWTAPRHMPLDGPTDARFIAIIVFNLVVLAPLAEEVIFRGFVYTALRRHFGGGVVIAAVSVLFAAFHFEPRHMVLVLPLGVALSLLRERSGSIKPTILLHAAYNLTTIGVTLALR